MTYHVRPFSLCMVAYLLYQTARDQFLTLLGEYVSLGLWSGAEPVSGLLCCCLPTYAPLMRRLVKSTRLGSWNSSTGSSHRDSRGKIRIPSFIALTGHSEYPSHSYWVGYKRFEKGPDTVELRDFVHGIVGNEDSPRDRNDSVQTSWGSMEGIQVTREVDVTVQRQVA